MLDRVQVRQYGGRYSGRCPAFSMAAFVSARLWKAALSMTMIALSGSLGIGSRVVQAWNTSLSLLHENSVTVGSVDPTGAPMTLARPLAFQFVTGGYNDCRPWCPDRIRRGNRANHSRIEAQE